MFCGCYVWVKLRTEKLCEDKSVEIFNRRFIFVGRLFYFEKTGAINHINLGFVLMW